MENIESKDQVEVEGAENKEEAAITLASLQKEKGWLGNVYLYQGFWCPEIYFDNIFYAQRHFKASGSDLFLATMPKSGTTWLKALSFAIANRHLYTPSNSPLLTSSPHAIVPFLEQKIYGDDMNPVFSSTRILSTHIPYQALPESIKSSSCRIICLCRNPYDVFNSSWHFLNKRPKCHDSEPLSIEDALNKFCKGVGAFGPFWDHILGYWKQSLVQPEKILFLMYEDLQEDIALQTKKLADFIGVPFTLEEERQGVIHDIIKLCSLKSLSELEVNKTGDSPDSHFKNNAFFRKGEVGDWENYFSVEMVERLNNVINEKLGSSGLIFKMGSLKK